MCIRDRQEAIFTKATQIYPNDFRAYNNLGKLAYQAGDLDNAESYFKKALSIKDAPEAVSYTHLILHPLSYKYLLLLGNTLSSACFRASSNTLISRKEVR